MFIKIKKVFILTLIIACKTYALDDKSFSMNNKIIIWDNDGTIMGSKNPNDTSEKAKSILPGVKQVMNNADFNCVISGLKSEESEKQDFDHELIIEKFKKLMQKLPLKVAIFSPKIGGVACFVVIKKDNEIIIKKAHEIEKYKKYIGQFKKPGIGMFVVMKDVVKQEFGKTISSENTVTIGDMWHDEQAAKDFEIPFISAEVVHKLKI